MFIVQKIRESLSHNHRPTSPKSGKVIPSIKEHHFDEKESISSEQVSAVFLESNEQLKSSVTSAVISAADEPQDSGSAAAVSQTRATPSKNRYDSLSIQLPENESSHNASKKLNHHRVGTACSPLSEEGELGSMIDLERSDVSLVRQMLEAAIDMSQRRLARTTKSHCYTKVCCIPSKEIISSLQANRKLAQETALEQEKVKKKPRSQTSTSFTEQAKAYFHSKTHKPRASLTESTGTAAPNNLNSEPLSPRDAHSNAVQFVGDAMIENIGLCKVYTASIWYPASWCPPTSMPLSPFHNDRGQQSELEVIEWCATTLGEKVVTPALRERLLLLESAKWAAFLAPFAGDEYVTLIGRFLAVFVIIDDLLVEQAWHLGLTARQLAPFFLTWSEAYKRAHGDHNGTDAIYRELTQLSFSTQNPILTCCLDGFTALADDYVQLGAEMTWCERMAIKVEEYIELGIREAIAGARINEASQQATEAESKLPAMLIPLTKFDHTSLAEEARCNEGKIKGIAVLEVLARQRVASIGWPMLTLQLERACGLQLSDSIGKLIEPAIQMASLLPALVNEMIGLARDLREGDTLIAANFSLVQRRLFNCSLSNTVDFALALHTLAIKLFDEQVTVICEHTEVKSSTWIASRLPVFLDRLRYGVRGYAHWHGCAARYKSVIAVDTSCRQAFMFPVLDHGDVSANKLAAIDDAIEQYAKHILNQE